MTDQYKPKDNTGFLFKNNYKDKDTQPDLRGYITLNDELIKILEANPDRKIQVSGWKNNKEGGNNYISLKFDKIFEKKEDKIADDEF